MIRLTRTANCECCRCRRNLDKAFFWLEEHQLVLYALCVLLLAVWCLWRVGR